MAAVLFGPTSCARLKKSTTQRKLANSALLTSSTPDQKDRNGKQLVSDKLIDQKEKIEEFIAEHEANLKQNELSLEHLKADKEQTQKKYDSYTDWWLKKAWNTYIWRKKELAELKNALADLEKRIISAKELIASIKLSIKNLKDARNWTHENSQKAKAHELDIKELETQLRMVQTARVATLDTYQSEKALAKENSDREDEAHRVEMAGLAKDIEEQTRELARLENGSHDLHVELEKKKNSLQTDIAKHGTKIQELEAKIAIKGLEIEGAEKDREQATDDYKLKLGTLQDHMKALRDDLAAEQEALTAGKSELEKTIKEGNASIEDLKNELLTGIATLEKRIAETHTLIVNQKKVNGEVMLSTQAKLRESVDAISRQIEDFIAAKKESLQELDELRKAHGEAATDAIVSETLHKAKEDLQYKLKLETDARDTAVYNIQRMKAEFARLTMEIEGLSKWYNGWWHRYIARNLPPLERDRDFLSIEIGDEQRRKITCEELISRLSAQIESKLNAAQFAEVEEAAADELEKQIADKQNEKKKEMETNREALRLEKEAGDDAIQTLRDHEADLRSKEAAVKEEVNELESGTHDKHAELEIAKKAINDIIETREETIQGLSGVLTITEHDEQAIKEKQQRADDSHAETIKDLNAEKQQFIHQKRSLEDQSKTKAAELTQFESDQSKRIEDVRANVAEGLEDLKQFKADAEESHANARITSRDVQQLKESDHQEEIERLEAEIESMKDIKKEAVAVLEGIEQESPHSA